MACARFWKIHCLETMYDLPSRTDIGTVIVNDAVISGEGKPVLKAERQPKLDTEDASKVDLKVVNSKSA